MPALRKAFEEPGTGRVTDDGLAAAFRKVEHGAVFSDDRVEALEIAGDALELNEPAPRDEHDRDAVQPKLRDGLARAWLEYTISGNRPVVVDGNCSKFHETSRGGEATRVPPLGTRFASEGEVGRRRVSGDESLDGRQDEPSRDLESGVERVSERHIPRVAGQARPHLARHVGVADASARIGKAKRAAGSR